MITRDTRSHGKSKSQMAVSRVTKENVTQRGGVKSIKSIMEYQKHS